MLSHNASRARSTRLRQSRAAVAEMGDSEALAKLEAALKDIASRYSRKEGTGISRDRLLSTFREADEDGSGTVSRDEFLRQLTRMRVALSDEEASAVFARLDADDSGAVDYREFVTQLAQHSDGDKQADKADKAGEKGGDARGSQRGKAARRRREAAAETAAKRPPSDDVDTARAKPSSQCVKARPLVPPVLLTRCLPPLLGAGAGRSGPAARSERRLCDAPCARLGGSPPRRGDCAGCSSAGTRAGTAR